MNKLILFTFSACPTGRSMGTVLRELALSHPQIKVETKYIDVMIEETNLFRIKENPTTLFINDKGHELYRVEGFKETNEMTQIIDRINSGEIFLQTQYEENSTTIEKYEIFLYQNQELVPCEVSYENKSSVKAPRITAIQQLIKANLEGFYNPFPPGTRLELIEFHGSLARVFLKIPEQVKDLNESLMKEALRKTLQKFGVSDVELELK
ncbi:thioredoxin family protein [Effusibacillus dendaii]|nr:thioredoxin family protein [Effusibacillus dendaii]